MYITDTIIGDTKGFDFVSVEFFPEIVVTEHPVELGATVSDHAQKKPLRFVVEAYVTETPRGLPVQYAVEQAVSFFERCEGHLLSVLIEGEGTFPNVMLESYGHRRTSVRGRGFSCRFKPVRIASSLSIAIPPRVPAPVAAVGAPTETDLGVQAPTPEVPSSKLYQLETSVIGLVKEFVN